MDGNLVLGLVAVPLLMLASGVLVAAEIALVAVRRTELDELVQARKPGAIAARAAVDRLDASIAAIQIGITAVGLLMGWLGEANLAGAIATHVRVGDPFIAPLALGVVVWAGIYLRETRLHALLPVVRDPRK